MYKHLLAATLLAASASAHCAPAIGTLNEYAPAATSNCGLFLRNPQGALAFYADTGYDGFVSSDGKVLKIHHIKTENHQQVTGRVQTGDSYQTTFGATGAEVKLDMKVVKGCEAVGSTCPAVQERGTLLLTTAAGHSSIPVTGGEHCSDRN